jgi:hypothetical protein
VQTFLQTKSEREPKPKPDKLAVARMRSSDGLHIGERLRDAARESANAQALADSYLIMDAARPDNYFLAPDMCNEFGERYTGLFTLATMSTSRLCPNYIAGRAHHSRKIVIEKIRGTEKRVGCSHKLVTLTKPKLIGVGVGKDFAVFDDALVRLRKSKWWTARVCATVKGEEVTLGDRKRLKREKREWSFQRDGYHVHAHLLVYSKHLDWEQLGEVWTKCLQRAAAKENVELEISTRHGRAVVDVRQIEPRVRGKRDITQEAAVFEVCKYVAKGSDVADVPGGQLLELDKELRGRRMLEFWGEYNKRRGFGRREAAKPHVHEKKQLTDSDSNSLPERKKLAREAGQVLCPLVKQWRKKPTLRETGARMCAAGLEKEWSEVVAIVGTNRREWRKADLIGRYAYNVFYRIDDEEILFGLATIHDCAFDADELRAHRQGLRDYMDERLDEFLEAAAIENENWIAAARRNDGEVWRAISNEQEDVEWWRFTNGDKKQGYTWITDEEVTNEQRRERKRLRDVYNDSELIKAILFTQGREAEWYAWVLHPGTPAPDVRRRA